MSTIDYNLHEEYKRLCLYSYKENVPDKICGWAEIMVESKDTGYFARVYYKNNNIVIVSRGTESDDSKDIANDIDLLKSKMPNQVNNAINLYNKVRKSLFSECNITFTGHSLGGSISELMSLKTGCPAITFNSYGIANIKDLKNKNKTERVNVINYGSINDIVFRINMKNNIGEIRLVPEYSSSKEENEEYSLNIINFRNYHLIKNHSLECMGDLKNSVDLKDINLLDSSAPKNLIKGTVSKNVYKDGNGHWVTIDGNHVFIEE